MQRPMMVTCRFPITFDDDALAAKPSRSVVHPGIDAMMNAAPALIDDFLRAAGGVQGEHVVCLAEPDVGATIELVIRVHADNDIYVLAVSTCGPAGRQSKMVAKVIEPSSPNPGIALLQNIMAVGMLEKICAFVRSKPWLNGAT